LYPHQDQNGASHANREPGNVNNGIELLPQDVSDCDFEIVGKHFKRLGAQSSKFYNRMYLILVSSIWHSLEQGVCQAFIC
jgi:hypothetical protein